MNYVTDVAVVGVLSALAVMGWTQRTQPSLATQVAGPAAFMPPVSEAVYHQVPGQPQVQTIAAAQRWERSNAPVIQRVDYRRYEYDPGNNRPYAESYRRGRNYDPYYSNNGGYYGSPYYRGDRPCSHSAAIVGGSAAAGAAVGGLAGGGKGAGIGALIGGAGGLIYDRATHEHARW